MNIEQVIPWLRPATLYDLLGLLGFIITVWQILADRNHKQQLVLMEREYERQIQLWRGIVVGSLALFVFTALLIASRKA